jgi:chemotaxis protein MotB
VTSGLEDSQVKITSSIFVQAVSGQDEKLANQVANDRIEVLSNKIKAGFEHDTNEIKGSANVKNKKGEFEPEKLVGMIHISIKQKPDSTKPPRKIETLFGDKDSSKDVYDNFASQVVNRKGKPDEKVINTGLDTSLVNPADTESKKVETETDPEFTEDNAKTHQ